MTTEKQVLSARCSEGDRPAVKRERFGAGQHLLFRLCSLVILLISLILPLLCPSASLSLHSPTCVSPRFVY